MATTIKFNCEKCGIEASTEVPGKLTLDAPEITHEQPCPKCGGKLSAPGGKYETDENNVLQRVGDCSI
ncbi:hypothetical protein [Pseudomonas sp. 2822-17]|uniref:hypothetical protein n=1 Tax=Pseudomonas sp. 2822-17 TaxID=1712678 RepID=UPI00117B41A8|nr:hypothetical protein [Pseudomonas sp. 2822-17]